MNIVALVGNLATDPELRHTGSGKAICTFRLAVSRANGTDADFFSVVTWERQAEVCAQYLSIGRRVAVDGRLHHSTWQVAPAVEGEEPQRRSKVEVVAHRVDMIGGPRREQAPASDRDGEAAATADPFAADTVGSSVGGSSDSDEFALH